MIWTFRWHIWMKVWFFQQLSSGVSCVLFSLFFKELFFLSVVSKNEIIPWNSVHSATRCKKTVPYTLCQTHSSNSAMRSRKDPVHCPWVMWRTFLNRIVFLLKSCQENLSSSIIMVWWELSAPGKWKSADDIRTWQRYNPKRLGHAKHLDASFIHFLHYKPITFFHVLFI